MIISIAIIIFSIIGIKVILFGKNGINNSLEWIIMGFILGYRTFEPFPGFMIHPIELFTYACALRIVILKPVRQRNIPNGLIFFAIFCILYFLITLIFGATRISIVEFKNTFLLFWIFFICSYINFNKSFLVSLCEKVLFATSYISLLGIIETFLPSIMGAIFGYSGHPNLIFSGENIFHRTSFLFWGAHTAANLIPPVFPALLLLKSFNNIYVRNNFLFSLFIFLNLYAIYLSGNRLSWLVITLMVFAILFLYQGHFTLRIKLYTIFTIGIFILFIYSQPVETRYFSTFNALALNIDPSIDSSGAARWGRAQSAIQSIITNPMGTGWGTQGWVHSDILQISATLGIIPGLFFLFSLVNLFIRCIKLIQTSFDKNKLTVMVLSCFMIHVIISLVFNGNILLVQNGVPLYLFWAIVSGYLKKPLYNIDNSLLC